MTLIGAVIIPGLGVRLVLVLGARPGIDAMVRDSGHEPRYSHGQRVTDGVAMEAAMQAAGAARMEVEARLSKVPQTFVRTLCSARCELDSSQWDLALERGLPAGLSPML